MTPAQARLHEQYQEDQIDSTEFALQAAALGEATDCRALRAFLHDYHMNLLLTRLSSLATADTLFDLSTGRRTPVSEETKRQCAGLRGRLQELLACSQTTTDG